MNFTLRQWAIIAGLSAVFIVAAIIVSQGEPAPSTAVEEEEFDEVLWCETANAISRWQSILDGSLTGDSLDDLVNLETTLDEARSLAPEDLRTDVARLYDFALIAGQAIERNDGDLEAGLIEAMGNIDETRVGDAIDRVDAAVIACGHASITDVTA